MSNSAQEAQFCKRFENTECRGWSIGENIADFCSIPTKPWSIMAIIWRHFAAVNHYWIGIEIRQYRPDHAHCVKNGVQSVCWSKLSGPNWTQQNKRLDNLFNHRGVITALIKVIFHSSKDKYIGLIPNLVIHLTRVQVDIGTLNCCSLFSDIEPWPLSPYIYLIFHWHEEK